MRFLIACAICAAMLPGAALAQSVSYQTLLSPGEVVLNISGTGSYTQRGNVVFLSGQMLSDAASIADADAMNQRNFELLVNSLGTMGISPAQIRKAKLEAPGQPTAGQARSGLQVYVEIYDSTRLGEITAAMEGADVKTIQPAQYDVVDREALVKFARQRALDDARRQAESYAGALTLVVRRIVRLDEVSVEVSTKPGGGVNEGDVVATAKIDVDFLLGPMFAPAPMPAPGTP